MIEIRRKKILVLIDDDVMVRHFIANNTFEELESTNELIVPNPETIAVAAAPIKSS